MHKIMTYNKSIIGIQKKIEKINKLLCDCIDSSKSVNSLIRLYVKKVRLINKLDSKANTSNRQKMKALQGTKYGKKRDKAFIKLEQIEDNNFDFVSQKREVYERIEGMFEAEDEGTDMSEIQDKKSVKMIGEETSTKSFPFYDENDKPL